MTRKLAFFSLCALVALTVGYVLRTRESASAAASDGGAEGHAAPRRAAPAPSESHSLVGAAAGNAGSRQAFSDSPNGAINGERVLVFPTSSALEDFLRDAKRASHSVIAVNPTLKAVRLRAASDAETAAIERIAGESARYEDNYVVSLPLATLPDVDGYRGVPFGVDALRFLGVSGPNAEWGEGVIVAILDTGALAHPILEGGSARSIDLIDAPGAPTALSPHGTAVASLVAGRDGAGVAPKAEILSIRVLDADGVGDTFTLAQGIVEAADRGAQVINMSLGAFGYSETLAEAIRYADQRGVALVAATGNEGAGALPFPAQFEQVIAVSAIDAAGRHAAFSNQGAAVDLAAPGVGVYAAWDEGAWISFTGTSAAAPYVAGGIAAIMSKTPGLSAKDAARTLLANANDTGAPGRDTQTGAGYIDLERAMRAPQERALDIALADIYPSADGTTLLITAQNRGTETIPAAVLAYAIDGGPPQTVHLGQLAAGEVASYELPARLAAAMGDRGLSLQASVSAGAPAGDDKPGNDAMEAAFGPPREISSPQP